MIEITTVEQLAELCIKHHLVKGMVYRLDGIVLPLYCAQVPANKGRERERSRKQRRRWCADKREPTGNAAQQFADYFLHFHGLYLFNDFTTALEFQLTFG